MAADDDLELYWADLHQGRRPLTRVVDLQGNIEFAREKTLFDMRQKYAENKAELNLIMYVAEETVQTFLQHWRKDLAARGSGGILDVVLEDSTLEVVELKRFIRAVPESLVQRIVKNGPTATSARGIHALLAIEYHYRVNPQKFTRDYDLVRDDHGVLSVTFYPKDTSRDPSHPNPGPFTFRLDETFDLSDVK